jgi:hypothetical protein
MNTQTETPMDTSLELIAMKERVGKLEKQYRRFKQYCCCGLIVLSAVLLMGQTGKRTVEANEFILRDTSGRMRGLWAMGSGGAQLVLFNENELARAVLDGTTINGPILGLYDSKGLPEIHLQVGVYGPEIALRDQNGKLFWQTPVSRNEEIQPGLRKK